MYLQHLKRSIPLRTKASTTQLSNVIKGQSIFRKSKINVQTLNLKSVRTLVTTSDKRLEQLRKDADANLFSYPKQLALIKELNKANNSKEVIERLKNPQLRTVLMMPEVQREFMKALTVEGQTATNMGQTALNVNVVGPKESKWKYFMIAFSSALLAGAIMTLGPYFTFSQSSTSSSTEGTKSGSGTSSLFNLPDHHKVSSGGSVRFSDVKGVDEVKDELIEVVDYLKNPDKYSKMGARMPKGILLSGSPGTGKTLLAKAIAGEAGVPFIYISGSSFDEMFVGVGARRVRNLFSEAKNKAPCIIFIDEIDSVGFSRKKNARIGNTKDDTLNQMLTELDGFKETEGIVLIGATNFAENLDEALTRPGRFDKIINVPLPDSKGRKELFDYYLEKIVKSKDVDSDVLAKSTPGLSGADISNMINMAAIKAASKGIPSVTPKLLEDAKDEVYMGLLRNKGIMDDNERKITAYHECGHVLVAMFTEGSTPVHKVTILPRGHALGVTHFLPERDAVSITKKQAYAKLAAAMGGRVAEELVFGADNITSGASGDFKSATALAKEMVYRWGMSDKVGPMFIEEKSVGLQGLGANDSIAEEEIKSILEKQYTHAKNVLVEHERELHTLAAALLKHETLTIEEIKQVLSGKQIHNAKLAEQA